MLPVAIWMQLKELPALVDGLQVAAGCQALYSQGHLPTLTVLPFLQHHLCHRMSVNATMQSRLCRPAKIQGFKKAIEWHNRVLSPAAAELLPSRVAMRER